MCVVEDNRETAGDIIRGKRGECMNGNLLLPVSDVKN